MSPWSTSFSQTFKRSTTRRTRSETWKRMNSGSSKIEHVESKLLVIGNNLLEVNSWTHKAEPAKILNIHHLFVLNKFKDTVIWLKKTYYNIYIWFYGDHSCSPIKRYPKFWRQIVGPHGLTDSQPLGSCKQRFSVSFQLQKSGLPEGLLYLHSWTHTPFTNQFPNFNWSIYLKKSSENCLFLLGVGNLHHPTKTTHNNTLSHQTTGEKNPATKASHEPPLPFSGRPCSSALRAATLPRSRVGANFGPQGPSSSTGGPFFAEVFVSIFLSPKKQ